MAVSSKDMQAWCETLLAGRGAAPNTTLADYLDAIPGLGSLEKQEQRATRVLQEKAEPVATAVRGGM